MSNNLILYSFWTSSCSWRVRIALTLKNLKYEYRSVNLQKNEHKNPEFLKLNPLGMVPALVHDGRTLYESLAIIEYLEENFPNKRKVLPSNPYERAIVRALAYSIAANTQPVQNKRVSEYVGGLDKEKRKTWAKYWSEVGFDSLEKSLQDTAGLYSYGDMVTLTDLCLVPQVYNAKVKFGVDMARYPLISRINEALMELSEFQETHPEKQPDYPKKNA